MEVLLFLPLLLILMYVLLIRPQQQRVRRQQAMVKSIDVGDEVVTASGIVGHVEALEDDRVWIEVAPGVTIGMIPQALGRKVEPATPAKESEESTDTDRIHGSEATDAGELDAPDGGIQRPPRRGQDGPEEIAG